MLRAEAVRYHPLDDDVDDMNMASERDKRRRKHLTQSPDAPTATAQGHEAPISYVHLGPGEAAKDHQGSISDMAIVHAQNHVLLPRMDWGEEEKRNQELFSPKVILNEEDQASYAQILFPNIRPPISQTPSMSWMDNVKVKVCQARYRIAYYKAMNPVSGCNLKDPNAYSVDEIRRQKYFEHLEDDFEWFFHPDDSWNSDLNDYQKIVLQNCMPGSIEPEYPDVDGYRELYNTYEMDAVYVKYYGEMSKKIKWIEEYLHLDARSAEWREMETRAWRQALRIATWLPHMTVRLAAFAFNEYIYELRDDASLKGLDLVYFEIWRLVVKDNREYKEAVEEVHAMDKFHMHKRTLIAELKGDPVFLTMRQMIYGIIKEGHIVANTEDDKARDMFKKGVARLKTKNMVNYAEKKMQIAEVLKLHKRIETAYNQSKIVNGCQDSKAIALSWTHSVS